MDCYTAVDVETTGLDPSLHRMIEIGAVRYENGKPTEKFEKFIDPGFPLPERIIELTNITDEMLKGAGSEAEVFGDFLRFLGGDAILGHNILFDYGFLKTAAARQGIPFERRGIDTLALSGMFHPGIRSKSLKSMRLLYGFSAENSHRGYYDALTAAKLYEAMKEKFEKGNETAFLAKPLFYKVKKQEPITEKQRRYLAALIKRQGLHFGGDLGGEDLGGGDFSGEDLGGGDLRLLTKSQASRMIDRILSGAGL